MYFKVSFETDNDAFITNGIINEISRILDDTKYKLGEYKSSGPIYDINGNRIGSFGLYMGSEKQ